MEKRYLTLFVITAILFLSFDLDFTGRSVRFAKQYTKVSEAEESTFGSLNIISHKTSDGRSLILFKIPELTNIHNSQQITQQQSTITIDFTPFDQYCSTTQFVDPNQPITVNQDFVDINDRYVVWTHFNSLNPLYVNIRGYDLGTDKKFGTADDNGPMNILTNVLNLFGGSALGNVYPRVNSNGLIAFVRGVIINITTNQYEIQLVMCNFSSCPSSMNIIDTIPTAIFGPFWQPLGQFITHDINDNKLIVSENDFIASVSKIVEYDLSTGTSQVIAQGPYPTFINPYTYWDLFIGENNLISWVKIHAPSVTGLYDFFINLPNTINPILISSQPYLPILSGSPSVGLLQSSTAYNFGLSNLLLYSTPENNLDYWDLKFKRYTNAISSIPFINNDDKHQMYPRITYHHILQTPMLVFSSFNSVSSYITTLIYDTTMNSFIDYKTILPPPNWRGFYNNEASNFNVISVVLPQSGSLYSRVVISEC